jgi:hypothetical protein
MVPRMALAIFGRFIAPRSIRPYTLGEIPFSAVWPSLTVGAVLDAAIAASA